MLGSLSRQSVPIVLVPEVCGIDRPPVRDEEFVKQLGVVGDDLARADAGKDARLVELELKRKDGHAADGVKHIAVPVGKLDAPLVAVQRHESRRQEIHVGRFLREPPPVGVMSAPLVVGERAEIHRRDVDHVAIEIEVASRRCRGRRPSSFPCGGASRRGRCDAARRRSTRAGLGSARPVSPLARRSTRACRPADRGADTRRACGTPISADGAGILVIRATSWIGRW